MLCKEQGITVLGLNAVFDILVIGKFNVLEIVQKVLHKDKSLEVSLHFYRQPRHGKCQVPADLKCHFQIFLVILNSTITNLLKHGVEVVQAELLHICTWLSHTFI